jgi:hypothetical protein
VLTEFVCWLAVYLDVVMLTTYAINDSTCNVILVENNDVCLQLETPEWLGHVD